MELNYRKLISSSDPCSKSGCNDSSQPCPPGCRDVDPIPNPHHLKVPTFVIITVAFLAATFFFLSCYAIYRYISARRRRRRSQRQRAENGDDFHDEEQGPMNLIDHPIWYIRTTGLQQSIIAAITVCKYKKGEGLIEGTECSICLSEFGGDENLRLLPKCNHTFYLPCIDIWLGSHTNCPMCRAPIVVKPAATSFLQPGVADPGPGGSNGQTETVGNSGENNGEVEENIDTGLKNEEEEEEGNLGYQHGRRIIERSNTEVESTRSRRSISMDSSSAAKINIALSVESAGNLSSRLAGDRINGKTVTGNENLATGKASSSTSTSTSRRGYSQSEGPYNGKNLVSSWYGQSQKKPSLPVRSF